MSGHLPIAHHFEQIGLAQRQAQAGIGADHVAAHPVHRGLAVGEQHHSRSAADGRPSGAA